MRENCFDQGKKRGFLIKSSIGENRPSQQEGSVIVKVATENFPNVEFRVTKGRFRTSSMS